MVIDLFFSNSNYPSLSEGLDAAAPASEEHASTVEESRPQQERRGQGARVGGQQGGRGGARGAGARTPGQGGRGAAAGAKSAPKFDDEKDFPTLGK